MIQVPHQIIGWHGHGKARIVQQDGTNIILDLSSWIDERGYGEWKDGIMIKKLFPKHFLILINMEWDRKEETNKCDDIIIGKGIIKGNKLHGILFSKNIFVMDKVSITFPHKTKMIGNTLTPDEYDEEELKKRVDNIKCT